MKKRKYLRHRKPKTKVKKYKRKVSKTLRMKRKKTKRRASLLLGRREHIGVYDARTTNAAARHVPARHLPPFTKWHALSKP